MPRHAAVVQLLPVACLDRRQVRIQRRRLVGEDRERAAPCRRRSARAPRGSSTARCRRRRRRGPAVRARRRSTAPTAPRSGSILRSLSRPAIASCQMPPCPVPDAFSLPGLALIASSTSLTVLYGESARTWKPAGSALTSASGVYDAGAELGQPLPVHHRDLDGDEADRVAVRRGLRDRAVADDAIAAGAVDDVDRLAEILLQIRAEEARDGVGAAARAPRHDQRDRTIRIRGARRCRRTRRRRARRARAGERCMAVPPSRR